MAHLTVEQLQRREEHWAIVDLIGKGGHIRTVPVPNWVKSSVDAWTAAAGITSGRVFRCVSKRGSVWGTGISEKVVWCVVKECAATVEILKLAPRLEKKVSSYGMRPLYMTSVMSRRRCVGGFAAFDRGQILTCCTNALPARKSSGDKDARMERNSVMVL